MFIKTSASKGLKMFDERAIVVLFKEYKQFYNIYVFLIEFRLIVYHHS